MSGTAAFALAPARIRPSGQTVPAGHFDIGLVGEHLSARWMACRLRHHRPGGARAHLVATVVNTSLVVANLEAPVTAQTNPLEDKPHLHKTSAATLSVFDKRFVLSLANNHIMDFGVAGLVDTLGALEAAGIRHAGAGLTSTQASAPCNLFVDGVDVAALCAADPRLHPATKSTPGIFPAHRELLDDAVRAAASDGAIVVVSLHLGLEHVSVPSPTQVALAETCLSAGATVFHFHHSHCQAGAAADPRGVVLFGTGNYVFTKRTTHPASRRTASWRVRVNLGARSVTAVGATPALIDARGLPIALQGFAAERQLHHLQTRCEAPLRGWHRAWVQLKDMLQPGFLYVNARNYAAILRKRGPFHTLRLLASGVKTQFAGH